MTRRDNGVDRLKWAVYVGAAGLILIQIPIGYINVQSGDHIELITRVLMILLGVFLIWNQRLQDRNRSKSHDFAELERRVDDDLRPAVRFVFLNAPMFSGFSDDAVKEWSRVAASVFGVEQERVVTAVESMKVDLEYHARTGRLPDE